MQEVSELRKNCALMLRSLRERKHVSKARAASLIGVDAHTYDKYESGRSSPSVPDFFTLFAAMGENAFPALLQCIYPDFYTMKTDISDMRDALNHYISMIAPDAVVREMSYIQFGDHGSAFEAQIAMLAMIDHMPMEYRYAIAQMVDTLYSLAESRGELVNIDVGTPALKMFRSALAKGEAAAKAHEQSYSTEVKR